MRSAEQKLAPYIFSYVVFFLYIIGLSSGELYSFLPVIFVFIVVPIAEKFIMPDESNPNKYEEVQWKNHIGFSILLWGHVLTALFTLIIFISLFISFESAIYETIGAAISTGIIFGMIVIPVAHEFLHREDENEQLLGKILLFVVNYFHFSIEHAEHHRNVGTDKDSCTAQIRESVYHFWFRSLFGGIKTAWKLKPDAMMINLLIALLYNLLIAIAVEIEMYGWFVLASLVGILIFETINYIQHYGLFRYQDESGDYEAITEHHSWNSNARISRWIMFDLPRHSDHHLNPNRPYQLLEHHEKNPQLPYSMPIMILLALFPPAWFNAMDPRALSIVRKSSEDVISLTPVQKPRDTFDVR